MSVSLVAATTAFRQALESFEPGACSGEDCARLAEELAATEKACGAVRLLAAARAVEAGTHRSRGFSDGASWLARQSGSTPGQARQALKTASALGDCPATQAALLAGDISVAQAREITEAESDTPGAEAELLPQAGQEDLSALRDRARKHLQDSVDPGELHRRQLAAKDFRHWRDREGMVRFRGALPPETGLPLVRRVELAANRARRADRAAGNDLAPFEAYAADTLAALVAGAAEGSRRSTNTDLVIVCDISAWRRGHAHRGEACHIIDGGPIPVPLAKELAKDAFLKAALHDGVAIPLVAHFGRHRPAELQTALDLGPVPEFTGAACVDCGRCWGLEWDHVNPVANGGPTEYSNLEARCWNDHQAKTERDRSAGLLGPSPPRPPDTS